MTLIIGSFDFVERLEKVDTLRGLEDLGQAGHGAVSNVANSPFMEFVQG